MKSAVVSFVSATGFLLPTAWSTIGADQKDVVALVRPGSAELGVDAHTTVKVTTDRSIYAPGDTLNATLVAISDSPRTVTVDVSVTEQENWPGSRVGDPDKTIAHHAVTLEARPDGGPAKYFGVQIAGWQLGAKTDPLKRWAGQSRTYVVHVAPLAGGEADPSNEAVVSVLTRNPEAYSVTVDAPKSITPGKPFVATVLVKNTSDKALKNVNVVLSPAPDRAEADFESPLAPGSSDDLAIEGDAPTIDTLAPGATKTLKFTVTPKEGLDHVGLFAEGNAEYGGYAIDMARVPLTGTVASR